MKTSVLNRYIAAHAAARTAVLKDLADLSKIEPLMQAYGQMCGTSMATIADSFRRSRIIHLDLDLDNKRVEGRLIIPSRRGRLASKWFSAPLDIFTNDEALHSWVNERIAEGTKAQAHYEVEDYRQMRRLEREFNRLPKARQEELVAASAKPKKATAS